jgi:His/Glu/Gln/Arg/opine family amino acid ABC transporter permease subunit
MDLIYRVLPILLKGAIITFELTLASMCLGLILGILGAVARLAKNPIPKYFSTIYVEVIRGTPLLVQLFIIYYGLPRFNIVLDPITSAILGLGINLGAYLTEVFRAAIEAIDKGQLEAAQAIGFGKLQTLIYIVLPQAIIIALPAVGNYLVGCLKDTALVSTISVTELLRQANIQVSLTFRSFEIYFLAGAIYLAMSYPLSRIVIATENRLKVFREERI